MAYTKEELARIWLQCAPMNAWKRLSELRDQLGGAEALWDRFTPALYRQVGEGNFALLADMRANRCGVILRQLDALQARPCFLGGKDYPARLALIDHPPDVLFVRGALPPDEAPAIAIVGSRRSTRYGANQARRIARDLARSGVTVVSGLARGIDAAAHWGALEGGGRTVAVLGSGLGQIYPPENKDLAQKILEGGGAIVSELSPDAQPLPYHFPVRNRIISGLSDGVLLIEAMLKSGTHSTINYALDQGKEVFALPGNVDAPGSELPLKLLKEGAALCTGAQDILDDMHWSQPPPEQESLFPDENADDPAHPILAALAREEKTMDELIAETGMTASDLGVQLTLLEISGRVERRPGRAYALARK